MSDNQQECPPCEKGAPQWMATFGDLMSLLLCFFVLLLSFSEMDKQKYKVVAGSMEKAFGMQRKKNIAESPHLGLKIIARDFDQEAIATRIKRFIGKELEDISGDQYSGLVKDMEIEAGNDRVTIRMMGESTFDSGKADIRPKLKPLLRRIGTILVKEAKGDVIIAGHTDNRPVRKTSPYRTNLNLSIARAASVAQFLLDNTAIDPKRLSTMGFGEYRPIANNDTKEGRYKNRRVEIVVGTLPRLKKDQPPAVDPLPSSNPSSKK